MKVWKTHFQLYKNSRCQNCWTMDLKNLEFSVMIVGMGNWSFGLVELLGIGQNVASLIESLKFVTYHANDENEASLDSHWSRFPPSLPQSKRRQHHRWHRRSSRSRTSRWWWLALPDRISQSRQKPVLELLWPPGPEIVTLSIFSLGSFGANLLV